MTTLDALAGRVSRGDSVTEADARLVLSSHDLIAVGMMADDVRRRMHGTRTTFVRVLEAHVGAPPASLPSATAAGELRIVGAPDSVESAVAAVRALAALKGGAPLTGFSLAEIETLAGAPERIRDVCAKLRDAGLDGISHVSVDTVQDARKSVEAARAGGLRLWRMAVDETHESSRVETALRARDLQNTAGGFRAFAPLPRTTSTAQPTTGYDDVKLVAMARLLVANVQSIQVDWASYGPKLAQVALTMGADDVDNVSAVDAGTLGVRRSPVEDIKGNIRAAGLVAVERDGRFEVIDG